MAVDIVPISPKSLRSTLQNIFFDWSKVVNYSPLELKQTSNIIPTPNLTKRVRIHSCISKFTIQDFTKTTPKPHIFNIQVLSQRKTNTWSILNLR